MGSFTQGHGSGNGAWGLFPTLAGLFSREAVAQIISGYAQQACRGGYILIGLNQSAGDQAIDGVLQEEPLGRKNKLGIQPVVARCGGRRVRGGGGLELFKVERLAFAEDDGAFDLVGELAHVAGPGIVKEPFLAVAGNRLSLQPMSLLQAGEEGLRQPENVIRALAQGWKLNPEEIEPMEQVFAEAAFGDELFEFARSEEHTSELQSRV